MKDAFGALAQLRRELEREGPDCGLPGSEVPSTTPQEPPAPGRAWQRHERAPAARTCVCSCLPEAERPPGTGTSAGTDTTAPGKLAARRTPAPLRGPGAGGHRPRHWLLEHERTWQAHARALKAWLLSLA